MTVSRRTAALASLAALAACHPKPKPSALTTPVTARPMDTKRLDAGFPALAQRARPGVFAIGVMSLDTTETWYWNTERAFPLAGLAQAPLAAAALAAVEAKSLALAEAVPFGPLDLSPPFSLVNQRWPDPPAGYAARAPAQTLMRLALQWGDNTAADVLLKRIGGPGQLTAWLHDHDIADMRIDRYAREIGVAIAAMPSFRPAWKDAGAFLDAREQSPPRARQAAMDAYVGDPQDTATVQGALAFLFKLAGGQLISPASTALLLGWMSQTRPGTNLFRAGWPRSARVAHKGAVSATDLGFTPAMGDLAVVTLADGRRYAMAGFLAASTGTAAERAALFSDAARLVAAAAG